MTHDTDGERRKHPRFTLRIFGSYNTCTIALDMVTMVDCALLDVGCGGVRIQLKPIRKIIPDVEVGQKIDFKSFLSDAFKPLSGLTGTVQWCDPVSKSFGVRFDPPVPEEVVKGLI